MVVGTILVLGLLAIASGIYYYSNDPGNKPRTDSWQTGLGYIYYKREDVDNGEYEDPFTERSQMAEQNEIDRIHYETTTYNSEITTTLDNKPSADLSTSYTSNEPSQKSMQTTTDTNMDDQPKESTTVRQVADKNLEVRKYGYYVYGMKDGLNPDEKEPPDFKQTLDEIIETKTVENNSRYVYVT